MKDGASPYGGGHDVIFWEDDAERSKRKGFPLAV
uniref:Uncharacterized protein n=1 Tax=Pyricularia oryzae (strain P131) TaxID=1143193 RepID=L7JHL7_PYRO1